MKEATGELSGTVITVVAIAAVAAIFTVFILPIIQSSLEARTKCAAAICNKSQCGQDASCSCTPADGGANITCANPYLSTE